MKNIDKYNRKRKNLEYYKTLLNIFRLKDNGRPNPIYDIIEIEIPPKNTLKRSQFLRRIRFYDLFTINRSTHIIPTSFKEGNTFYVNNYINWDQYNTLFDPA